MTIDRTKCPIVKSVEVIGDKWILMLLREMMLGATRFDDFQSRLHISKSVLSSKLGKMVSLGLSDKVAYQVPNQRTRYEYQLTRKGRDLFKIIISLADWGNTYLIADDEAKVELVDKFTEERLKLTLTTESGEPVRWRDTKLQFKK